MQSRMPIIVALVAGLAAILLLNLYVGSLQESLKPSLTPVVVAAHQLPGGTVLDAKDITEAMRPTDALPKLAIKWEERSLYLGQRLDLPVQEGDYVLANYFGGIAVAAQRLSEKIDAKANQRALTIPVNAETSLERSIRPGDRIDLLITYTKTEAAAGGAKAPGAVGALKIVTSPLLENVYVLSTGQFGLVAIGGNYSTITVLASPDEAKLIIWAMKLGELSIILRNPKDVALSDRAFLAGDASALGELGKQALRPEDVISQRRSGEQK
jgi:pilus assembly protein CpaB